jgi:hypothetical protein
VGFLEDSRERVIGDLPVAARLEMGFERLTLYFTDRRIIVGRGGKAGAGSVPTTFMFGSLGSAFSGLFGGGKRGAPKQKSGYPSPARILSMDKDNFSIRFEEVVSIDLTKTAMNSEIVILSRDDKFDFTSRSRYELVRSLFENSLGSKLRLHTKD